MPQQDIKMIFHIDRRKDDLLDVVFYKNENSHSCDRVLCGIEESRLDSVIFTKAYDNITQILIPFEDWLLAGKPEKLTRTITP